MMEGLIKLFKTAKYGAHHSPTAHDEAIVGETILVELDDRRITS
jgi:hypothetical protein